METSIHHSTPQRSTSVVGLDDDSNYRTPSILAIVSLILGLAAPLVLIAPLLMVIPIAGAVLALVAIRRIASSDGALIGRTAAILGLALSVACVAAAFSRTAISETLLSNQARATAIEWIAHLQSGDVDQAFKLTTASRQAPPPKAPPGAPEPEAEPQVPPIETFRADPVVHFLLDHSGGASVAYVRDEVFDPAYITNARIQQLYEVAAPAKEGAPPTTTIELIMQRVRGYSGAPNEWLVAAYRSDALPAADSHNHAGHVH